MVHSSSSPASSTTRHSIHSQTRHERIRRPFGTSKMVAGLAVLLCFTAWIGLSRAMTMTYCSSINTAGTASNQSDFQSDGLCFDFCKVDFAYSVVLYKSCWCTNYAPSDELDLSECTDPCPGYPADVCGNTANTYYGYMALPYVAPSGTLGASDSSTTNTVRSTTITTSDPSTIVSVSISSVAVPTTVTVQLTQVTDEDPTTTTPLSSASSLMTTTRLSSSLTSSTWSATPFISVVTLVGSARTVTVTPTSPGDTAYHTPTTTSQLAVAAPEKDNFFSNTGRVAGVFTVIALAVVALVAALIWFFTRKNRHDGSRYGADTPESAHTVKGSPAMGARKTRSNSTLGIVPPMSYSSDKNVPSIMTTGPGGYATPVEPRLTDQRLDPQQVWMRFENDNSSRVSIRSLRDDQDYSRRVLKVLNPDD